MSYIRNLGAVSVSSLLIATPALADVSAADVWTDWQNYMNSYGLATTVGAANQVGATLTVTDFTASMAFPEGEFSQTIPMIEFTEQGDGTVAITMSPEYPITLNMRPEYGEAVDMTINVLTEGLSMVASGEVDNTSYDFSADAMRIVLADAIADGQPAPVDVELTVNGVQGTYVASGQDPRMIDQVFNADGLTLTASGEEDGNTFALDLAMQTLNSTAAGSLMDMSVSGDMPAALRDGGALEGTFTHGPMTYALNAVEDGDQVAISGSANSGDLAFGMSADGLSYGGSSNGTEITLSGSQIPFPEVNIAMAESGFALQMPLLQSEEGAQDDVALAINLTDFTISDQIWGIFDPFGKLPRDPATIAFDLTGKVNMFIDLVDPEKAAEMETEMAQPGELHALDLNNLVVSAVGAALTGSGSFTFDNSDLETFEGMPAPTGSVDMQLVGGNKLIDTLVDMGLLPDEQAMGARMMLGLFARPGEGEDTLTSTIEVKGDGSVSANGQRIR